MTNERSIIADIHEGLLLRNAASANPNSMAANESIIGERQRQITNGGNHAAKIKTKAFAFTEDVRFGIAIARLEPIIKDITESLDFPPEVLRSRLGEFFRYTAVRSQLRHEG